jgi:hypothetical protein
MSSSRQPGTAAATPWAILAMAAAWLVEAPAAMAASPSPSPAAIGDPRSAGQGPGLVGDPLSAIAIVVLIGLVAVGATLLYVRATGGSRGG